jgi:hypothetical protein
MSKAMTVEEKSSTVKRYHIFLAFVVNVLGVHCI